MIKSAPAWRPTINLVHMATEQRGELEDISELLRCYICTERVSNASMCPHCCKVGCFNCIKRWVNTGRPECPHCRTELGVKQLIPIPLLNELGEKLPKLDNNTVDGEGDNCPTHTQNKLLVYCEACAQCICHECALWGDHKNCLSYKPLKLLYEKQTDVIKAELNKLKRQMKETLVDVEQVDYLIEEVKAERSEIKREAQRAHEKVLHRLDCQARSMLQQLTDSKKVHKELVLQITEVSHVLEAKMMSSHSTSDLVTQTGELKQEMTNMLLMVQERAAVVSKIKSLDPLPNETVPGYTSAVFEVHPFQELRGRGEDIYSGPLHLDGMVWRLKIYPGGHRDDDGTFLAVFIEMMSGCERTASYQYSIELLYQGANKDTHSNYKKEYISDFRDQEVWGYRRFFELSKLEQEGFLVDDKVVLRFSVRAPSYYDKTHDLLQYVRKLEKSNSFLKQKVSILQQAAHTARNHHMIGVGQNVVAVGSGESGEQNVEEGSSIREDQSEQPNNKTHQQQSSVADERQESGGNVLPPTNTQQQTQNQIQIQNPPQGGQGGQPPPLPIQPQEQQQQQKHLLKVPQDPRSQYSLSITTSSSSSSPSHHRSQPHHQHSNSADYIRDHTHQKMLDGGVDGGRGQHHRNYHHRFHRSSSSQHTTPPPPPHGRGHAHSHTHHYQHQTSPRRRSHMSHMTRTGPGGGGGGGVAGGDPYLVDGHPPPPPAPFRSGRRSSNEDQEKRRIERRRSSADPALSHYNNPLSPPPSGSYHAQHLSYGLSQSQQDLYHGSYQQQQQQPALPVQHFDDHMHSGSMQQQQRLYDGRERGLPTHAAPPPPAGGPPMGGHGPPNKFSYQQQPCGGSGGGNMTSSRFEETAYQWTAGSQPLDQEDPPMIPPYPIGSLGQGGIDQPPSIQGEGVEGEGKGGGSQEPFEDEDRSVTPQINQMEEAAGEERHVFEQQQTQFYEGELSQPLFPALRGGGDGKTLMMSPTDLSSVTKHNNPQGLSSALSQSMADLAVHSRTEGGGGGGGGGGGARQHKMADGHNTTGGRAFSKGGGGGGSGGGAGGCGNRASSQSHSNLHTLTAGSDVHRNYNGPQGLLSTVSAKLYLPLQENNRHKEQLHRTGKQQQQQQQHEKAFAQQQQHEKAFAQQQQRQRSSTLGRSKSVVHTSKTHHQQPRHQQPHLQQQQQQQQQKKTVSSESVEFEPESKSEGGGGKLLIEESKPLAAAGKSSSSSSLANLEML